MSDEHFEDSTGGEGIYFLNGDRMTERGYVAMPNVVVYANFIFGLKTLNYKDWLTFGSLLHTAHFNPSVQQGQKFLSGTVHVSLGVINSCLQRLAKKLFLVPENHGRGRPKSYKFNTRVRRDTGRTESYGDLSELIDEVRKVGVDNADDYTLFGHTPWPNFMMTDAGLNAAHKGVLLALEAHRMRNEACYPGQKRLAKMLGMSIDHVGVILKELKEWKWVRVEQRGQMLTNEYYLNYGRSEKDTTGDNKKDALVDERGLFVPKGSAPEMAEFERFAVEILWSATKALLVYKLVDSREVGEKIYQVERKDGGFLISIDDMRRICRIDMHGVPGYHKIEQNKQYGNQIGLWSEIKLSWTS